MNSEERLEILDRFRFAEDELREIAKTIPSSNFYEIVNESMDRLDQIVYLWWRKG